ncbi:MAG: UDP-N-acetylmuramate dehydrogenase [Saprospiraceae bacterium]
MQILEHQSLQPYNTFGIAATARYFVAIHSEEELRTALQLNIKPVFILGGGSNILLTQDFNGLVIKNSILGKEIINKTEDHVIIKIGAGENWHETVRWSLAQNFGGLENLSLIPGTVGASPMQNIGAYGVEIKDVFHQLEAMERATGNIQVFDTAACQFGYRESIFKKALKDQYIITRVYYKLTLNNHIINTTYGAIQEVLSAKNIINPTIHDVSDAVITIRSSKLPDPAKIGNSGSFFKNPEILPESYHILKQQFPAMPAFPGENGKIKVPAGWLIEQCGWKGTRRGDAGCYDKQALVLVNYGNAKGAEIWQLALDIADSVEQKFGIRLTPEVNVI